jgi:Xaa-Pro aminopeptidase
MVPNERMERLLEESDVDLLVASTVENVYYTAGTYCVATKGLGEAAFSCWSADAGGPYLVMPAREMSSLLDNGVDPAGVYPYGATNIYSSDSLSAADERVLSLQESGDYDDPIVALAAAVEDLADGPQVAVEREGFSPDEFSRLSDRLSDHELPRAQEYLHELRRVKTDEEIRCLRRSAEITESSMQEAMAALEPGTTEAELAADFRARVCEKGGEPLFLTVGFGDRTAYTHPLPGNREIQEGDLVRWDGGCTYRNYCSDVGRTYAFGSADPAFERTYEALSDGLSAALGELRDGVDTGDVYDAGVAAVQSSGVDALAEFDPFHLGHGIGVEIYDPPTVVPDGGTLESGMVLCIEPPYNELGHGGFLIEDEVLVTDDGYEKLTDAPDELRVFG